MVVEVIPGSPAEDAGFERGEVIMAADGEGPGAREGTPPAELGPCVPGV